MSELILAIDEGTTSTRAIAFDLAGRAVATHAVPIAQMTPQPAWVEQDAAQIWQATLAAMGAVAAQVGPERIAAIGITNQRETVVFWDALTAQPLAPAIVWQDRRGAALCETMKAAGEEPAIQARTGLVLDSYFSASKIAWAQEHWPAVREAAEAGRLRLGTIDSWLLWKLSDGAVHATDATNASRTLLMDLAACRWDAALCERFGVPMAALPAITDSAGMLAETRALGRPVPVTGVAGDQQAAFIGHGCLTPGQAKATFGTGAFLLAHAGAQPAASRHRLLGTVAYRLGGQAAFALEGAIFVAGDAVRWMVDMGWFDRPARVSELAASVEDSGGVAFVPALTGLGAPHWRPDARGLLAGLSTATRPAHIAFACLDSVAQQAADLLDAFAGDGVPIAELRIGGGMAASDWLAQRLADMGAVAVERSGELEATALGAAMLAAHGAGLFATLPDAVAAMRHGARRFAPALAPEARAAARGDWARAVARALA
ncbi:MAG: FGGY family carbohydrate kinase [Sphingomonadaceae bacterium]